MFVQIGKRYLNLDAVSWVTFTQDKRYQTGEVTDVADLDFRDGRSLRLWGREAEALRLHLDQAREHLLVPLGGVSQAIPDSTREE